MDQETQNRAENRAKELQKQGLGWRKVAKQLDAEGLHLSNRKLRAVLGIKNNDRSRDGGKGEHKAPKPSFSERALMAEQDKKFDPEATPIACIEDLRRVQKLFPFRHISRVAYRHEGKYSDATWNRFFGTFHEFRRQAGLELSRYQHQHERHIAKHASNEHYREFYCKEVLPYVGQYERRGKAKGIYSILSGSDCHDREADPFVLDVFIDTAKRLQPDVILLNGDVFDMYEFSRFDIDPREVAIKERFDFVKGRIFAPLREACPDSQIDINLGNHEWRILKLLADRTPHLKVLLSDVMGLTLDDVFGVHEFEINLNCKWDLAAFIKRDIEKQVKENYIVYWDAFVAAHIRDFGFGLSGTSGHTHRPETKTSRNLAAGNTTWTTTGSIARTDAHYIEGLDKSMNGFGIFHVHPKSREVVAENILIPGDFAAVAGTYYHRT